MTNVDARFIKDKVSTFCRKWTVVLGRSAFKYRLHYLKSVAFFFFNILLNPSFSQIFLSVHLLHLIELLLRFNDILSPLMLYVHI